MYVSFLHVIESMNKVMIDFTQTVIEIRRFQILCLKVCIYIFFIKIDFFHKDYTNLIKKSENQSLFKKSTAFTPCNIHVAGVFSTNFRDRNMPHFPYLCVK